MTGCFPPQVVSGRRYPLTATSMLAVLIVLFSPLSVSAQTAGTQPTTARQVMTATLNRWGGAVAWSAVTTAEVTGDVTYSLNSSRSIDWFDDLSVDPPKSRRTSTDSNGKSVTKVHVGSAAETITFQGKSFREPTPDIAVLLLPHLPALALLKILTDRRYLISFEAPDSTRLMRISVRSVSQWFAQEWSFSGPNMTIVSVRYKSYNPITPQVAPWNTVTYEDFGSSSGLSFPAHTKLDLAGALTASYTFTHQVFNQPDASAAPQASGGVQ